MCPDHVAAFMRYAAERRRVRGPRGDVVALARWHAPQAGREGSLLPAFRNRADVRRWASETHAGDFVAAAERLWLEFADTLEVPERAAARLLVDLDAGKRREDQQRAAVMAWADALGDKAATAAELREVWSVREAIGALRPGLGCDDPDYQAISPTMVSRFVRDIAAAGLVCNGWRIVGAGREGHSKAARFRLESAEG